MQHLIGEEKERTVGGAVLSLFLLVTKRLYGKEWEWSIGQIKMCCKKQHVEIDDMKEMPDLICGKAAVGGNYNSTRDSWHDGVYTVINKLEMIRELKTKDRKKLIKKLKQCMLDEEYQRDCPTLILAVQRVRILLGESAGSLDAVVKKIAPSYFERPYSINVYEHTENEKIAYLHELVASLREQNKTQGMGGVYGQYAYNDFRTICNILYREESVIDYKKIRPIVQIADDTIKSNNQTCEAKIFALRVLIEIQMLYPRRRDVIRVLNNIDCFEEIKANDHVTLQKRYSNHSLLVMWNLARMYVLSEESDKFISDFYGCCEAEQVALLDSVSFFSSIRSKNEIEKFFINVWPLLLMLELAESERIRFFISVIYSNLYGTVLEEKAMKRLVSMLEDISCSAKIGAMSRLKKQNATGSLVEYIYQQGRVDNNYCVREVANR